MRADLDRLMQEAEITAVLVLGRAEHNPFMYYLTGGGHLTSAALFMQPGRAPVIYCGAMEREEAAKSGLKVVSLASGPIDTLIKDPTQILEAEGIRSGCMGIYGEVDAGSLLALVAAIKKAYPEIVVVGQTPSNSIFMRAMETKDQSEIAHIRRMGQITTEVVGLVQNLLMASSVRADEVLVKPDGSVLTVSDVKKKISLWLAERGAEDAAGVIFAIGRDAGIPHSVGNPSDPIQLGKTIVFDIFPSEAGGGYFYDFTRTWSLGYATPEAQALYDEVRGAYDEVVENMDLNAPFKEYQRVVCDRFHSAGHDTPMHTKGVLEHGYVHSLGHGVGLNIHERPASSHLAADDNLLRAGVVITVEPGLYYPERGMGVRIEDTFWFRPDGKVEKLAEYSYDFVLPMKHWSRASGG